MGNFYTNITLYHADRMQALALLRGRKAAVSPTVRDWTIVWDEESETQDIRIFESVARRLAHQLRCPAWAVLNHDDDFLAYMLFIGEQKIDEYNSFPGYFDGTVSDPAGGNSDILAKTFGIASAAGTVEAILRDKERHTFAIERHQALIEALGMPGFGVGIGYRYLTTGQCPPGLRNFDTIRFSQ